MILLTLNSDKRSSGASYDFTTSFQPNIQLSDNSEIALYSIQLWNSLPNISVSRNNNKFRFYNGLTWSGVLTIPTGNYSVDDLNLSIQGLISSSGGVGSNIVLLPNYNTLQCQIVLKNSYQLDLSIGNLYLLLGWASQIVTVSGSGYTYVDISNGITGYNVHCSLIDSSSSISNGSASDVIYTFTPSVGAGSLINKEVINLVYIKCNSRYVSQIRVYLTDQNNTLLSDLSSENTAITLIVK
jgi:hypothetical protein